MLTCTISQCATQTWTPKVFLDTTACQTKTWDICCLADQHTLLDWHTLTVRAWPAHAVTWTYLHPRSTQRVFLLRIAQRRESTKNTTARGWAGAPAPQSPLGGQGPPGRAGPRAAWGEAAKWQPGKEPKHSHRGWPVSKSGARESATAGSKMESINFEEERMVLLKYISKTSTSLDSSAIKVKICYLDELGSLNFQYIIWLRTKKTF